MKRSQRNLLDEADCVVVGAKLGQAATLGWEVPRPAATVVHLDVDAEEIGRNAPSLGLHGDAALGLQALLEALPESFHESESEWDLALVTRRAAQWWENPPSYARPARPVSRP